MMNESISLGGRAVQGFGVGNGGCAQGDPMCDVTSGYMMGQDPLEAALTMASDRDYTVGRGDTPTGIARKFGITLDALLAANPQKPTMVVRGIRTFQDLQFNEGLKLPAPIGTAGVGVGQGAAATVTNKAENIALGALTLGLVGAGAGAAISYMGTGSVQGGTVVRGAGLGAVVGGVAGAIWG
jgi:LysM domain